MKRYVRSDSYADSLRRIRDSVEGDARINEAHRCVDVYDDSGKLIGQCYPTKIGTRSKKRYRYIYKGPGKGEYSRIAYDSEINDYSGDDPYVKQVNDTQ